LLFGLTTGRQAEKATNSMWATTRQAPCPASSKRKLRCKLTQQLQMAMAWEFYLRTVGMSYDSLVI
jgi:hypothetical protein